MSWRWDPRTGRYHHVDGSQYFLSRETALRYVQSSIDVSSAVTDQLASLVAGNKLAPADWLGLMREEIKSEYIRQYLEGIGGRAQMTQADWGSVGGMIKEQYDHLAKFCEEIRAGTLSEAQIKARSRMYINSAREAYERARSRVARRLGYDEVALVLGAVLTEHCEDCESWAKLGFQPIAKNGGFPAPGTDGFFPGDGQSICLTSCKCSLVYRNSTTGEEWKG